MAKTNNYIPTVAFDDHFFNDLWLADFAEQPENQVKKF